VDEEVEHALRWGCGEIDLDEVFRKLADPAVITVASAFSDAFELDEAGEVRIPRGRRECVIFFS
jgi:sugar phosphate isomerase/epimerase